MMPDPNDLTPEVIEKAEEELEARLVEMQAGTGNGSSEQVYISKEDRLEVENLHLRVLNLVHETSGLERQIQEKHAKLQELNSKILAKKVEMEEKYGIDLNTHEVRDNGAVILRGTSPMPFQRMLQQAKQG
jgi:hypothetical protein